MKMIAILLFLETTAALSAADRPIQIAKYRYPWGVDTVTFSSAKITREELDKWIRLSPYLSPNNDLLVPIDIRRCIPGDKEYVGCKGGVLQISNVDVNIRKVKAIKKSLEEQKWPEELKPVVAYFSEIQRIALWALERQQKYLLTRDVSALAVHYDGIDPKQNCAGVLDQIARSPGGSHAENLVTVSWYNCVMPLEQKRIGEYPMAQWKAFLRAYEITEVNTEELPND